MLSATKTLKAGCFSAIILVFTFNFHSAFVIVQEHTIHFQLYHQCQLNRIVSEQWWHLAYINFSFSDKTKKFWALWAIFSDPACCFLPYRPSCLAHEILFMDSPTMGVVRSEPAAGTFGAHSFKTIYGKQKLAAAIIKTSQRYSERT